MAQRNPVTKPKAILNWVSQVWPFAHGIKKGDLVSPTSCLKQYLNQTIRYSFCIEPGAGIFRQQLWS
jgi:hypothetical protein